MTLTATQALAKEITEDAVRLPHSTNGNPRYYVAAYNFRNVSGDFYRPAFADMYRGKKFGAGWVFTSYSLENDIRRSVESLATSLSRNAATKAPRWQHGPEVAA